MTLLSALLLVSLTGVPARVQTPAMAAKARAAKLIEVRSFLGGIDGVQLGFERDGLQLWFECPRCSREERARVDEVVLLFSGSYSTQWLGNPPRDPLLVLQGVREVLGEGPDETPDLTLEVRSSRVVVVGVLRSDEDRRRLELAMSRFPELSVHVER